MRFWSIAYIIIGLAILPQAYWGALFLVAIVLPILALGDWPIRSVPEGALLISSAAVVAAALLSLLSGLLFQWARTWNAAIALALTGSALYWMFLVGRYLGTSLIGGHLSVLLFVQSLLIGIASIIASVRLIAVWMVSR